jgi:hypothetical protein
VLLQLRNRRPLSYLSLRYHDHSSFEIDQYGVDVVDKRHGLGILQWDRNGSFVFGVAYQIELLLELHFDLQMLENVHHRSGCNTWDSLAIHSIEQSRIPSP